MQITTKHLLVTGWIATFSTLALLALIGVSVRDLHNDQPRDIGGVDRLARDVDRLRASIERLESQMGKAEEPQAVTPDPHVHPAPMVDDATLRRLDALEQLAQEILERGDVRERDTAANWSRFAGSELGVDALSAYQEALRDPGAPVAARLDALETLARFPVEMNALSPILGDIVDLFGQVSNAREQVKVVEAMDGCLDPPALEWLGSLIGNADGLELRVRREAARALRKGAGNPLVKDKAQALLELEKEPDIRLELMRTIDG